MTPDPLAMHLALERVAASLTPIAAHLNVATGYPPMPSADWLGPASLEFGLLESELRARVAAAERLVAGALADTRRALAELAAGAGS
jgi:hypothetical protein